MQIPKILSHRAVIAAAVVTTAVALTLAYGVPYGSGNQVTYLVEPLHRAHPALFLRDWLITGTTQYHPVFAWLAAPIFGLDPQGPLSIARAFEIAQLVVMTATFVVIYLMITGLARRAQLIAFLAVVALLALGGGRALAGSYLFAGYLQPSSLASLGWLAAMLAWLRGRWWIAGVWLALAGACHVNFLVLGVGVFALAEVMASAREAAPGETSRPARAAIVVRRIAVLVGPSLVVLMFYLPALLASAHAHDPDAALHVLVKFHAPGHYDPARVRRWVPPLVAWLAIAWGALPVARTPGSGTANRLWWFAAAAIASCVAAAAIASIPPLLGVTRLFVWRIAPFGQLAAQLVVITAALAEPRAVALSTGRKVAIGLGAATLIGESMYLGSGVYLYTAALVGIAAIAAAGHGLRRPALAMAVAVTGFAAVVVQNCHQIIAPPLFAPECEAQDCAFQDWVRTRTPVDAVFLVPPYDNWFRLFAQRAIVVDVKSPPLYPDEIVTWYRRLCAIVDAAEMPTHEAVIARWNTLTADQVLAAARRFDVEYVLLEKQQHAPPLAAPVAYEDGVRVVYRLR